MPMDLNALKADLHQENEKTLEIIRETDEDIYTVDYELDKDLFYHIVPPTKEWLKSKFIYGQSIDSKYKDLEDNICNLLLSIDQNMLINLNNIIFFGEESDINQIADSIINLDKSYDWEENQKIGFKDSLIEYWPEIISDEHDIVGCYWYSQNSIIIDVRAIELSSSEIVEEDKKDGFNTNLANEILIGIYTTITHEIRHLGLENPFLPEDEYPLSLKTEEKVEQWGLEVYENFYL